MCYMCISIINYYILMQHIRQAIILAAGKGTRMGNITINTPKPLLTCQGKTLLQHKIEMLPEHIDNVIIVIGYLGNQIKEAIGTTCNFKKVHYAVQDELNGTAGALMAAKKFSQERFLVLMGDDIYSKEDLHELSRLDRIVLAHKVTDVVRKGEFLVDSTGHITGISEQPHHIATGYINTGCYALDADYFSLPQITVPGTNELGIPHTLVNSYDTYPVKVQETSNWFQVTNQEDLDSVPKEILEC